MVTTDTKTTFFKDHTEHEKYIDYQYLSLNSMTVDKLTDHLQQRQQHQLQHQNHLLSE
ncbi:hypothetical protein PPL_08863 [Heterostelium album PN500]|uniref:Uncharacterized protein n=1 Tax=Heterostelium pallidum (strain ATCC 26659 / Pp 5 / PN500) TaxID=670386 RepID=D3BJY3_HETP5|nr:hypothetical protein PPL_08863 [Heterostelium album PN500]EFA78213.1 hypothetical protein PPL_08863 [Heterostelium album PN500]|eukprot:XP_020430339.1 hypothetical protein PPL_08863 [Heterostelium album PN500]